MFHLFQDTMHDFQQFDRPTLQRLLADSHPHCIGVTTLKELKKFYWLFADLANEHFKKMRELQFRYYQSLQPIDLTIMKAAEQDYLKQLMTLRSFSVFYACHHYLGTKGFESVSLD